jgi:hypothetical protein
MPDPRSGSQVYNSQAKIIPFEYPDASELDKPGAASAAQLDAEDQHGHRKPQVN